jgi:hypothetical protein
MVSITRLRQRHGSGVRHRARSIERRWERSHATIALRSVASQAPTVLGDALLVWIFFVVRALVQHSW